MKVLFSYEKPDDIDLRDEAFENFINILSNHITEYHFINMFAENPRIYKYGTLVGYFNDDKKYSKGQQLWDFISEGCYWKELSTVVIFEDETTHDLDIRLNFLNELIFYELVY